MKIIAIDGAKNTGKTELSLLLSKATGYTRVKFPNTELCSGKHIYRILKGEEHFDAVKFQFLQNTNKKYTIQSLDQSRTYIFDRYTLSEKIHGILKGLCENDVNELISKLPVPDFTIILHGNYFSANRDIFSDDQLRIREMNYSEGFKIPSEKRLFLENNRRPEELVETVLKALKGVGL